MLRLRSQDEDQLDIQLGADELVILANALRQLCDGVALSEDEFQAVIGVSRSEAAVLLMRIDEVLERLGITPESD
jgi:hypothetical protein